MKHKTIILLLSFCFLFNFKIQSQNIINWEWQNQLNVGFTDFVFEDNFIYAVGNFTDSTITLGTNTYLNAGGSDIIICKLDTLGNVIWSQHFGSSNNESLINLCVDNNHNVLAIGTMENTLSVGSFNLTSNGNQDALMIKCSNTGNVLLAKNIGTNGLDRGEDIATDYNNDIHMVVSKSSDNLLYAGTNNTYQNAILKMSSTGTEIYMHFMREGLTGLLGTQNTKIIKYNAFDSTIVISGKFESGYNSNAQYTMSHSSNLNLSISITGSPSWVAFKPSYLCKTNINGIAQNLILEYSGTVTTINDITTNPSDGNIFFTHRVFYSLGSYGVSSWKKCDKDLNNIGYLPLNLSSSPWFGGDEGTPVKINYFNNSLYGLLHQDNISSTYFYCGKFKTAKLNLISNNSEIKFLDYGHDYFGCVGFNEKFCVGNEKTLGVSCPSNCIMPYSLHQAPDVQYCSGWKTIGYPDCNYVKGGTPPYTFSWSPTVGLNNATLPQPTISGLTTNTTYTLTVTDQMGLVIYDTINVNVGVPTYGPTTYATVCPSQLPYVWENSNYTYGGTFTKSFQNSTGCDSIIQLNLTVLPNSLAVLNQTACDSFTFNNLTLTQSGTYYDTLMNANGCDSLITLNLTMNNSITNTQNVSACDSFSFNNQALTQSGTYYDTLVNANGCDSIITLNLTMNNSTTSTQNISACDSYFFNNQTLTQNGTYYDTLMNANGCDSIITLNLSISTSTSSSIIQSGSTLTSTIAGAMYQWIRCVPNFAITGATSQSYTPSINGNYAVIVTQNGCSDTSNCVSATGVGVEDYLQNNISISPNPSTGVVRISSTENLQNAHIKVLSLTGQLILQKEHVSGKNVDLDLSSFANGIYFMEIKTGNETYREKMVKE